MESLIRLVRQRMGFGQSREEIAKALVEEHKVSPEDAFLAYHAALVLNYELALDECP